MIFTIMNNTKESVSNYIELFSYNFLVAFHFYIIESVMIRRKRRKKRKAEKKKTDFIYIKKEGFTSSLVRKTSFFVDNTINILLMWQNKGNLQQEAISAKEETVIRPCFNKKRGSNKDV
jgi:hypothetical protein